mmetsp:Transcript_35923/g.40862  ORF Transcript_35923/g.40862 Transcript_35923/m.40862 type:complete len:238 (-) Transcript_35923:982-1695(-)
MASEQTLSNDQKVVLHTHPFSQPGRAVLTFLKINKIPHDVRVVELAKGDNRSDEFLKMNPLGQIPVLDDNGFYLTESHAILRYLAQKYSVDSQWFGKKPTETAKIDEYLGWHSEVFRRNSFLVFGLLFAPSFGLDVDKEYLKFEKANLEANISSLNRRIQESGGFVCGNKMTVADLVAYQEARGFMLLNYDICQYDYLKDWVRKMQQIPELCEVCTPMEKTIKKFKTKGFRADLAKL